MKQSLQLKLGQQLVMTPQLQQAIKLLQLSTVDLQQEIQEALETNPMLEVQEGSEGSEAGDESETERAEALNGEEASAPRQHRRAMETGSSTPAIPATKP